MPDFAFCPEPCSLGHGWRTEGKRIRKRYVEKMIDRIVIRLSCYRARYIYLLIYGRRSSRQGSNPAGESPALGIVCSGEINCSRTKVENRQLRHELKNMAAFLP